MRPEPAIFLSALPPILLLVLLFLIEPCKNSLLRYWKNKNKRLCDYDDLHESSGLQSLLLDGLIDSNIYWSQEYNSRKYINYMCFLPRLSSELEGEIESRYSEMVSSVWGRAAQTIHHFDYQSVYYGFDEEMLEMMEKIRSLYGDYCFICEGSGTILGPPECVTIEIPCNCNKD